MLETVAEFKDKILALPPTENKVEGVTAFVDVVGDFMDKVQAGSSGSEGIFTLNRPAMVAILLTQQPVTDNSWIANFVQAWQAGVTTGVITPSTVTNAAWTGSGNKDTVTSPAVPTTVLTLPAAIALLLSELANVNASDNPPEPLAQAIRDATLAFTFTCIGLGPPSALTPIPIPFPAQ